MSYVLKYTTRSKLLNLYRLRARIDAAFDIFSTTLVGPIHAARFSRTTGESIWSRWG